VFKQFTILKNTCSVVLLFLTSDHSSLQQCRCGVANALCRELYIRNTVLCLCLFVSLYCYRPWGGVRSSGLIGCGSAMSCPIFGQYTNVGRKHGLYIGVWGPRSTIRPDLLCRVTSHIPTHFLPPATFYTIIFAWSSFGTTQCVMTSVSELIILVLLCIYIVNI